MECTLNENVTVWRDSRLIRELAYPWNNNRSIHKTKVGSSFKDKKLSQSNKYCYTWDCRSISLMWIRIRIGSFSITHLSLSSQQCCVFIVFLRTIIFILCQWLLEIHTKDCLWNHTLNAWWVLFIQGEKQQPFYKTWHQEPISDENLFPNIH